MLTRAVQRCYAPLTRRLPVLRIRDFRLLLADRLLAPASVAFSMVGVSFAVLDQTHGSTAQLSYVLAAQIAPSLIFALIGGVIADRIAPQLVIMAGNILMAVGEGTFGILVLTGHPRLWQMIALECVTGIGVAVFYPASSALLPRVVPGELLQEASAVSRLAMNGALMSGAVLAGFVVAAVGPGWALATCGAGMLGTVPLMLALRVTAGERTKQAGMYRELREGWSEFRSHTWLWVIVAQFAVVLMAWFGLIAGGLASLRFTPRRPMLFVALSGGSFCLLPLALAAPWPTPAICVASFAVGLLMEIMMVQWTVALARNIPPDKLARVSSYDVLGSVMAMPVGAVLAGPIAAWAGVRATEYGAAALIALASVLALLPRDIRTLRTEQLTGSGAIPGAGRLPGTADGGAGVAAGAAAAATSAEAA
jgi:MFS family permease